MSSKLKLLTILILTTFLASTALSAEEIVENNLETLQEMDKDDSGMIGAEEVNAAIDEYYSENKYSEKEIEILEEVHNNEYEIPYDTESEENRGTPYIPGWDISRSESYSEEFHLKDGDNFMVHETGKPTSTEEGGTSYNDRYLKLQFNTLENGKAKLRPGEWELEGDKQATEELPDTLTVSAGQSMESGGYNEIFDNLFYCKNTQDGAQMVVNPNRQDRYDCRNEIAEKTDIDVSLGEQGESRTFYLDPSKDYQFNLNGETHSIEYINERETRRLITINGEDYHLDRDIRISGSNFLEATDVRNFGSIENDNLARIKFKTRDIQEFQSETISFKSWINSGTDHRFHYPGGIKQIHLPEESINIGMQHGGMSGAELEIQGESVFNPCDGSDPRGIFEINNDYSAKVVSQDCSEYGEDIKLEIKETSEIHKLNAIGTQNIQDKSLGSSINIENGGIYHIGGKNPDELAINDISDGEVEVTFKGFNHHSPNGRDGYYGEFTMSEGELLELPREESYLKLEETETGDGIYTATFSNPSEAGNNNVYTPEDQFEDDQNNRDSEEDSGDQEENKYETVSTSLGEKFTVKSLDFPAEIQIDSGSNLWLIDTAQTVNEDHLLRYRYSRDGDSLTDVDEGTSTQLSDNRKLTYCNREYLESEWEHTAVISEQDSTNPCSSESEDDADDMENSNPSEPTDEESNENTITVQTSNPQTGTETNLQITTKQTLAESGYQVVVENPEGETVIEQEGTETNQTITFTPETNGQYTIKILPQAFGQNLPIFGDILQGGALTQKTINVGDEEIPVWEEHCKSKGFGTTPEEKVECLENNIIPSYFKDTVGDNPEVAESLCQDLLDYGYNQQEKICTP